MASSVRARALRRGGHHRAGTPDWPRTRFSATVMVGTELYSWWTTATPAACERALGNSAGRLAVDLDRTGIGLDQAGDDLDQRALAGAVLAEQRHHLAGAELEIDLGEGLDAAVALGQAAHQKARSLDRAFRIHAGRTRSSQAER